MIPDTAIKVWFKSETALKLSITFKFLDNSLVGRRERFLVAFLNLSDDWLHDAPRVTRVVFDRIVPSVAGGDVVRLDDDSGGD